VEVLNASDRERLVLWAWWREPRSFVRIDNSSRQPDLAGASADVTGKQTFPKVSDESFPELALRL